MSDATFSGEAPRRRPRPRGWTTRLIARPGFQRWASRFPLTRGVTRADGEALFDLVAGFVHSQALAALIELGTLRALLDGPQRVQVLALRAGSPDERMRILLQAGTALGLLRRSGRERYRLTRKGAALQGVPGLEEMILHHRVLYRDLENPAAFFRGEIEETELARFWPYVFGAAGPVDTNDAARYSNLMAESQGLVADETLQAVSLKGVRRLMDVGGGTGAFISAVASAYPAIEGILFDLPEVVAGARSRLDAVGVADRIRIVSGSFRTDALPDGAEAISLVRVLYDHGDDTVGSLLQSVHAALPRGGRIIVSEPMSGGASPTRAGDAYFAVYTLAMGTGRTRAPGEIAALLKSAGFGEIRTPRTRRPFVTSVVEGVKLD